jgi:steroid delta-isomerase-like uncharacterized protein
MTPQTQGPKEPAMGDVDRNIAVVRAAIAALNRRDLDAFFALHTEDMSSQEVYFEEPLDRDRFRPFLEHFFQAYPDARIETVNIVAAADTVVVENVMDATFLGEFESVPPNGRHYQVREAVFFELVDGLIRRARIYLDRQTIREQLEPQV